MLSQLNYSLLLLYLCIFVLPSHAEDGATKQRPLEPANQDYTIDDASCHNACQALQALSQDGSFKSKTQFVNEYDFDAHFWSAQQRAVRPACVYIASSAVDIPPALQILRDYGCVFTIRSGGHAPLAGASNSDGGVVLDLDELRGIETLEKTGEEDELETTRVGPGNRWGEVYQVLEKMNRSVVGGRDLDVGVGGFLVGGGISHITRRHGWAADNVLNFELILPNGTLKNVNQASSPDLFWALRGGGNNFGIVTRFDLETHEQGPAWGGYAFHGFSTAEISAREARLGIPPPQFEMTSHYLLSTLKSWFVGAACQFGFCTSLSQFIDAATRVFLAEQDDPYAQLIISMGYSREMDAYMGSFGPAYGKVVYDDEQDDQSKRKFVVPEVFKAIDELYAPYNTFRVAPMSEIYGEISSWNEDGMRQLWKAATFRPSAQLISEIMDIFMQEVQVLKRVETILPVIVFQPINVDEIRLFGKNGGNCLGIEDGEGPLMIFLISIHWSSATDDALIKQASDKMFDRAVQKAKDMQLYHRFIYQNYAGEGQDVFEGYGAENHERLREIQRSVDPDGWWRTALKGGSKL